MSGATAEAQTEKDAGEGDVEEDPLVHGSSAPKAIATPSGSPPAASFPIPESGIIRDIVDLVGPTTESPDSTLALATLVMLSAVCGWSRPLEWGESTEPCIVYACICGPSAKGKKTTGMRSIESIFRDAGCDLKIESGGHVSGRGLVEIAMGNEVGVFYVKEPKVRADEYLPGPIDGERIRNPEWEEENADWASWHEKRRSLLEEPPSVVLVWDEFGKMMNVENDWQRDTRADLLSMYNGWHRGVKTSGKGGISIPKGKTQLSMIATMTDDDLRRSLNAAQVTDGLMGRILFSPPGTSKSGLSRPPDKEALYHEHRESIIRKLLAFQEAVEWPRGAYDAWSDEAKTEWDAWYHNRFNSLTGMENLLFSRGQATAVKMAVLFALAEASATIEVEHIRMAIAVLESSIAVSMSAYESHIEAQRDRYTDAVLQMVAAGPKALTRVLERGMVGGKEPGEKTPDRQTRALWIKDDPRLTIEKSATGKGHTVSLA